MATPPIDFVRSVPKKVTFSEDSLPVQRVVSSYEESTIEPAKPDDVFDFEETTVTFTDPPGMNTDNFPSFEQYPSLVAYLQKLDQQTETKV